MSCRFQEGEISNVCLGNMRKNVTWNPKRKILTDIKEYKHGYVKIWIPTRNKYQCSLKFEGTLHSFLWSWSQNVENDIHYELWLFRRMLRWTWMNHDTNKEVLRRVRRELYSTMKWRKIDYLAWGTSCRSSCVPWLKNVKNWTGIRTGLTLSRSQW